MKIPYECIYCDQVSTRKWNLSKHIERKHEGLEDPFKIGKKNVVTDSLNQARNNYEQESFWQQLDTSDPFRSIEKLAKFKNITEELKQFSRMELYFLLGSIINLLESK
jgi:hypothetical protein